MLCVLYTKFLKLEKTECHFKNRKYLLEIFIEKMFKWTHIVQTRVIQGSTVLKARELDSYLTAASQDWSGFL